MLEYALYLEQTFGESVSYCYHHAGEWRLLHRSAARWILSGLAERWFGHRVTGIDGGMFPDVLLGYKRVRAPLRAIFSVPLRSIDACTVYINVSHKAWRPLSSLRRIGGDRLKIVALLHDLMPLTSPQFFPAPLQAEFLAGLDVLVREADLIVTNTRTTRHSLDDWARDRGILLPPTKDVPFGIRGVPRLNVGEREAKMPHFVFLGGDEERKNFSLLRDVWRRLHALGIGPALYAVGLQEESGTTPGVRAVSGITDIELARLMRTSRALLFPSLAEGFGFPLWEAFSVGVPAICSDLPVFEEVGGGVAELLPSDSVEAWVQVVAEYCRADSPLRARQVARVRNYPVPTWKMHFEGLGTAFREHLLASSPREPTSVMVPASSLASEPSQSAMAAP